MTFDNVLLSLFVRIGTTSLLTTYDFYWQAMLFNSNRLLFNFIKYFEIWIGIQNSSYKSLNISRIKRFEVEKNNFMNVSELIISVLFAMLKPTGMVSLGFFPFSKHSHIDNNQCLLLDNILYLKKKKFPSINKILCIWWYSFTSSSYFDNVIYADIYIKLVKKYVIITEFFIHTLYLTTLDLF